MNKKSYFKGFISGVLVVLLATNIVFATGSNKSIKVAFENIKMIFDGVEKTPNTDSKPITYNGKIYVPLDFAARSVGKSYKFDAKSKTAYIGVSKDVKETVAKTSDGLAQLTFPKDWKSAISPNPETTLFYANAKSYITVVPVNKSSFSDDATIEDYYSLVTKSMSGRLENQVVTESSSTKINNYPALQFEIQGEFQKLKLKYLITIVETEDSYYQLIAYTSQNEYDKCKNSYLKIFNTFKEISK